MDVGVAKTISKHSESGDLLEGDDRYAIKRQLTGRTGGTKEVGDIHQQQAGGEPSDLIPEDEEAPDGTVKEGKRRVFLPKLVHSILPWPSNLRPNSST